MATKSGFGTLFKRETATPGTYATVGTPFDVVPPALSRDMIDTTSHTNAGGFRSFIGGLRDMKEATLVIAYEPGATAWDDLTADFESDAAKNYKIEFAGVSGDNVVFSALCTGLTPLSPLNDKMTLAATFKPVAKPTWS